ncbi:MAG: rhomboid family intramembrane serine protease [Bacteroidales bacterium]|jgi:membrane associated rhomboid family serine protease|nr:rhomboid family intramembrane serine protease [Bacteroidales bacterium]
MTEQFRPRGFSLLPMLVKNLLIINGLMFVAQIVAEKSFGISLEDMLGLHYPGSMAFKPWQFITYMFLHGNFGHLFFNMFALWMFGYALENIWGPKRFLFYYLVTGIGAALVHYLVIYFQINPTVVMLDKLIAEPSAPAIFDFISQTTLQINQYSGEIYVQSQKFQEALEALAYNPENRQALLIARNFLVDYREYYMNLPNVIGASGAVFGILLAFGMLFPNTVIYIYFFFPLKAKYFVIIYGLIELFYGFSGAESNVAHFAHLGGMVFGFFLILYWKKKGRLY